MQSLKKTATFAPAPVLLITGVAAATIMGDSMLYNVLPSRVESFGLSVGLVGVLLSANRVVRLISNPVAAWAIQRYGLAGPLIACVIVAIGTTAAYGTAPWFGLLLLGRILWGVTFSVFRLSGYLIVLENSREGSRGRMLGVFSSGMRIGSIVGVLLGGLLFDLTGRTASFLIIASLGLLALPAALALTRRSARTPVAVASPRSAITADIDPNDTPRAGESGSPLTVKLWAILISHVPELSPGNRRVILSASITYFCFQLVMNGVLIASLGFFLSRRLEGGVLIIGVMMGIATLNGILISTRWIAGLSAPYFGHLGDTYGKKRILIVAVPVCMTGLVLLASSVPLWLALLWLPIAFGATAASIITLDSIVGGLAPPARRAAVMSRYATWQDSGSAIGPLAVFATLRFAALSQVYLVGAAILAIALTLFLITARHLSSPTTQLRRDSEGLVSS